VKKIDEYKKNLPVNAELFKIMFEFFKNYIVTSHLIEHDFVSLTKIGSMHVYITLAKYEEIWDTLAN
jgi:hypothetical protein